MSDWLNDRKFAVWSAFAVFINIEWWLHHFTWAACFEDSSSWEARSIPRTRLSFLLLQAPSWKGHHPTHELTMFLHCHNSCRSLPCRLQILPFKPSKTCKFPTHATVPLYMGKLLKDTKTYLVHPFPTLDTHFVLLQSPQTLHKLHWEAPSKHTSKKRRVGGSRFNIFLNDNL